MDRTALVHLTKTDGLGVITLARADKLNALSTGMRHELGVHLGDVAADRAVRVVLLRAEGRAFCAGADLADAPTEPMGWRDRILLAQFHHTQIVRMQKPVIAAVQGAAVGGGASLALAADILVMADDARLVFPFTRLGLVPDGGAAALLQAKASPALALDLLLTGGELSARDAAQAGLTRRVVPAATLDETARALAQALLRLPAEGLMLTKALVSQYWTAHLQNALTHEADAFALATTTDGHRRALAGMRERLSREERS